MSPTILYEPGIRHFDRNDEEWGGYGILCKLY